MKHIETIARGICIVDGKILLCLPKNGAYSYLPGGHIEFGETARVALEREMREETGLVAKAGAFRGVVETVFEQKGETHAEISLVYEMVLSDAASLAAVTSQEDWIAFKWVPLTELGAANLLPTEFRALAEDPERTFG